MLTDLRPSWGDLVGLSGPVWACLGLVGRMAGMVHGASQWFWDPAIWLPPNVTWESFNSQQVVKEMLVEGTVVREAVIEPGDFARFGDLWYPIPLAVLVMLLRHFVEKYFFKPLGVRLGLKDSVRRGPAGNPVLEKAFRRGSWEVDTLAREAAMTRIQVNKPFNSQIMKLPHCVLMKSFLDKCPNS